MRGMLSVMGLNLTYPTMERALRDITFSVGRGELLLIMGPTGSGKSSIALRLMNIIPHTLKAESSGSVTLEGEETVGWPVNRLATRVQMLLQNPEAHLFSLTAEDDVMFGLENLALPREELFARTERSLGYVGLLHKRGSPPHELSSGEQQRAAIACAMAMEPEVLIFDEPFTNLDPAGKWELSRLLKKLKEDEKTIILIEHRVDEVLDIIDSVLVLKEGRIFRQGDAESVLTADLTDDPGLRLPEGIAGDGSVRSDRFSPATGKTVLSMRGVECVYEGGTEAVAGVDLQISEGDFIALMGGNGAGKTTLAKCMAGLIPPSAGRIEYPWHRGEKAGTYGIAREIGYVFQRPEVQLFCSTVREELEFGMRNYRVPKGERVKRLERVADMMGLEGLLERHPHTLSRGEMRRVALASVMVMEPRMIILDEPTVGQDHRRLTGIMEYMTKLNEAGTTIVLITHDIALAARHCNRGLVMMEGRIAADDRMDRLLSGDGIMVQARLRRKHPAEPIEGV